MNIIEKVIGKALVVFLLKPRDRRGPEIDITRIRRANALREEFLLGIIHKRGRDSLGGLVGSHPRDVKRVGQHGGRDRDRGAPCIIDIARHLLRDSVVVFLPFLLRLLTFSLKKFST